MPTVHGKRRTVHALPQPLRKRKKAVPLTTAERKIQIARQRSKASMVQREVASLYTAMLTSADEMSQKYGKKPRYYMSMFFKYAGQQRVSRAINPFNAWVSNKAEELNAADPDRKLSLKSIREDYTHEYQALTKEQKDAEIKAHEARRERRAHGVRITSKSKMADVNATLLKIDTLFEGLNNRVGVQVFYVLARSDATFAMEPRCYFSGLELEKYLELTLTNRWNTTTVGTLLEAFALGGGTITGALSGSHNKAKHLKQQIRDEMNKALASTTDVEDAQMQYEQYETAIVQRYGVVLEGWTHDKFARPSNLGSSLPALERLLNALKTGACKFRKLNAQEREQRLAEYKNKVAMGSVVVKERKKRSDAGKPRGPQPRQKKRKAATPSASENGSAGEDDDGEEEDDDE